MNLFCRRKHFVKGDGIPNVPTPHSIAVLRIALPDFKIPVGPLLKAEIRVELADSQLIRIKKRVHSHVPIDRRPQRPGLSALAKNRSIQLRHTAQRREIVPDHGSHPDVGELPALDRYHRRLDWLGERAEKRGNARRKLTRQRLHGSDMVALGDGEIQPVERRPGTRFQHTTPEHIGHEILLGQIVGLIDLCQGRLSGTGHIFIRHRRFHCMQQTAAISQHKAACELRSGIDPQPKCFSMLGVIRLSAPRVIDLPKLCLRANSQEMSQLNRLRRDARNEIESVEGKSILSVKIDVVPLHAILNR